MEQSEFSEFRRGFKLCELKIFYCGIYFSVEWFIVKDTERWMNRSEVDKWRCKMVCVTIHKDIDLFSSMNYTMYNTPIIISQKYLFVHINSLQCYELTRRCNHFLLYAGFSIDLYCVPWSIHCECVLMPVTDPGFLRRGRVPTPEMGKAYYLASFFSEKCMKMGWGEDTSLTPLWIHQWMRCRDSNGLLLILTFGIGICLCLIQWRIHDFQERRPNPKGRASTYYLAKFSLKMHGIKENWFGAHIQNFVYVDPSL